MQAEQIAAVTTLTYMVRAMIVMSPAQKKRQVGEDAQPWAELLDRLSVSMRRELLPVVVPLLSELSKNIERMTDSQKEYVGAAARRMLAFGWDESERPAGLILTCLEGVCRTYESDPSASASLLRRSLKAEHLAAHGYQEMPFLVREVERLIPIAPELVEDIYRAVLGHEEQSDEAVPLGHSLILPMRSNRRQDFQLAVHNLGDMFRAFSQAAPVHATGAVLAAVSAKVSRFATLPGEEAKIQIGDVPALLIADSSCVWDHTRQYREDIALRLLDEFESMLARLAQDPDNSPVLDLVLHRVASESGLAAVWRRVLRAAASAPNTIGMTVLSLLFSPAVLTSYDTYEPAGEFIRAIFPLLSGHDRARVEGVILRLHSGLKGDELDRANSHRDRLLGCLSREHVVSEDAKNRVDSLRSSGGAPPNDPPYSMSEFFFEVCTERDDLRREGVRVDDEANRGLIDLGAIAGTFRTRFLNEIPSKADVQEVLPNLQSLHLAFFSQSAGVDAKVTESAEAQLTGACAVIALVGWLSESPDLARFLRTVFLEFAVGEPGEAAPAVSEQFDHCPAIDLSARWYAAVGLCRLARFPAYCDDEIVGAIARLSRDPVPSVRMAIGEGLGFVLGNATEAATEILVGLCREEMSLMVVSKALVGGYGLARNNPEILEPLVADAFARAGRDNPTRDVAKGLRQVCLRLSLATNHTVEEPYAGPIASLVFGDVVGNDDLAGHLVFDASAHLLDGALNAADRHNTMLRLKSIELLTSMARDLAVECQRLNQCWIGKEGWSEEERRRAEVSQRLAYQISLRVHSSLEGIGRNRVASGDFECAASRAIAARFLHEGSALFDTLLTIPFANVIHSVLQGLEQLVECDPGPVLLRIRTAVRAGQRGAYQLESLAIDLIARLVRRFLADYRRLLQEDIACRDALVEILDVFVRVGWPQAMELTFRLDEVFR
jgi:hypothetical protein